MDVENVARKGLTSWRTAQQKRNLAIDRRVLGEIVDHKKHVAPGPHEVLSHGAGGIGRQPLQARCGTGFADNEETALRRTITAHRFDHLRDRRRPLADRGVDADYVSSHAD